MVHEGGYYIVKDGLEFIFSRGDGTVVLRESDRQLMGSVERWLQDERWRRGYFGNIPGQGTVRARDVRAPRKPGAVLNGSPLSGSA